MFFLPNRLSKQITHKCCNLPLVQLHATTCGLFIIWNDVLPNEAPRLRAEGFLTCFTELEKTKGADRVGVTTIMTLRFLLVQYFVVVCEHVFSDRIQRKIYVQKQI